MQMKYSDDGKAITKFFEQIRYTGYPDPATGGEPATAGIGHTGFDVRIGVTYSQAQVDTWFEQDIAKAEAVVNRYAHNLTQGQFDCLVDMVFNMGSGFIKPDNINGDFDDFVASGDIAGMRERIPQFRKANGKVMLGLVRRRAANLARFDGKSAAACILIAKEIETVN